MSDTMRVRRAAVLGAGVMGAQIAAHLVNAEVPCVLFELPAEGKDPDAHVKKAIKGLAKMKPPPLATPARARLIETANYETGLPRLSDCDLVIEAVAERPDIKHDLYRKITPHLKEGAVLATNTSGISLSVLEESLPDTVKPRFCGVHFFNPPRYMHLVELIAGPETDESLLDDLEAFLVSRLGKGVLRAKDTPNFVANRIGVFSMLSSFHQAARLGIPFDVVDAITGPAIGRPKSATCRTADVVGLDTLAHVIEGSSRLLPDDPWHKHYLVPAWLKGLLDQGFVGAKVGTGIYKKVGGKIHVMDGEGGYGHATFEGAPEVQEILGVGDANERLKQLRASDHPQAEFLWCIHRDVWHYAAVHLADIAYSARDLDFGLRWGFGWKKGPFELWQEAGWGHVASWIAEEIADGRTMASRPLPPWVAERESVHTPYGSWDADTNQLVPRSTLGVYKKQAFTESVVGEVVDDSPGETLHETDAVRLWRDGDDVGVLSFKSKLHVIGDDVLDGIEAALDVAETECSAVVIWQDKPPFSAGANLQQVSAIIDSGDLDAVDAIVRKFQRASTRFSQSEVPVVAAVDGMALGGGCEFAMHAVRTVCSAESYLGLVEIGVGVLPAGGGLRELARRAAAAAPDGDPWPFIQRAFEFVAKAVVSASGEDAIGMGLLRDTDTIVMNSQELLTAAKAEALALAASWRPPIRKPIKVCGRTGAANLEGVVVNMHAGGWVSDHDAFIATKIAKILCGGDVDAGTEVTEDWVLNLERRAFVELCGTDKTRARIAHMLETGKPLRN